MAATAAVYNRLHNASFGNGIGAVGGGGSAGNALHSQLARSLERILEEAHFSGELILANRKLKDFPKTGTKYNLADTVIAVQIPLTTRSVVATFAQRAVECTSNVYTPLARIDNLSRNRFCELPEEITTFPFLETLFLYHNTIRSIPESIKNLTSLTYLDLRSNQLSTLPREVCFLPLQVLLVSNNRLTALPDELGRMDRLTDLDAAYNQLTALPARIGELRSLRSFSLRSNQLMYLPRELTCLTLISLDVSNNRIASLPLEIRQMSTLVEFNLENNPLTSPPASLCVRGLVHVFKYLETQATKDEKGSRAGGNYDGYTTLRRAPRHNSSGNVLETHRSGRHNIDSGYSTCDGIDKRWSHDMPSVKSKNSDSPIRRMTSTPPNSLCADLMDASLTSSTSTIVDDDSLSLNAAFVKPLVNDIQTDLSPQKFNDDLLSKEINQSPTTLHQHISYTQSSSSNGSSPEQEDIMLEHQSTQQQNGKSADEKLNKNLGNIQTYREYKEALKQQRNQEITSVYKIKGQQKQLYDMSEATNALNSNSTNPIEIPDDLRINGIDITNNIALPKSIMKNTANGQSAASTNGNSSLNSSSDDNATLPKKPIQKVIPSRNTELMMSQATKLQPQMQQQQMQQDNEKLVATHTNGDCLGYVKPNSPNKTANGSSANSAILSNNNKYSTTGIVKSPLNGSALKLTTPKTHRSVTWNHDIPPEKLSFTMRREFDRQREETELMTQLRSIIETRLKMTLPEDIASALTDGVILCHLANYVHPRSVASIHVPSPGVSKLTMARCRRNVDNFLEACRKIGVDEELICSCVDVVPAYDDDNDAEGTNSNYIVCDNNNECDEHVNEVKQYKRIPNPAAVFKTVSALIAMDFNPHHQTAKYLHQQQQKQQNLKHKLQHQQQYKHEQQQQHHQHNNYELDEQQTATCTKQQMLQTQHEIIAKLEFNNSTLNFNAKCHFENSMINGNHYNNGHDNLNDNDEVAADDVVDAYGVKTIETNLLQDQKCVTTTTLIRPAELKTFQKIKLNLITSHGNNGNKANNNNNYCSTLTKTLQTIVETDNDGGAANEESNTSAAYEIINEKTNNDDELALKVTSNVYNDIAGNKYKLLELPTLNDAADDNEKSSAIVSKRIEFFEHSTSSTTGNISPPASKSSTVITPNGIVASAKSKVMNNIFSIYHVGELSTEKLQNTKLQEATMDKKLQGAGSPLLKHDSYVLTIVLSCIFIVTFLLLIYFPLPG